MEIKTTGYKVVDDRKIAYSLTKTKDIDDEEAKKLIGEFFENFKITGVYKETEKIAVAREKPRPKPVGPMTTQERRSHIGELPAEFTADDYTKHFAELGCTIKEYTVYNDLRALIKKKAIERDGYRKKGKRNVLIFKNIEPVSEEDAIEKAKKKLAEKKVKEAIIKEAPPL